jgi:hypothetical protein
MGVLWQDSNGLVQSALRIADDALWAATAALPQAAPATLAVVLTADGDAGACAAPLR